MGMARLLCSLVLHVNEHHGGWAVLHSCLIQSYTPNAQTEFSVFGLSRTPNAYSPVQSLPHPRSTDDHTPKAGEYPLPEQEPIL